METLLISVPETKSALVKQILAELGVTIKMESRQKMKPSEYAKLIDLNKEEAETMLRDIQKSRDEW